MTGTRGTAWVATLKRAHPGRARENIWALAAQISEMPRNARVVAPGLPYHITQRGTNRQRVFLTVADRSLYLRLVRENQAEAGVEVPGGEAVSREIGGDGTYEIQSDGAVVELSEFGYPAATMNNDDDGMRPSAGRNTQFAELQRGSAVRDTGGFGDGKLQEVVRSPILSIERGEDKQRKSDEAHAYSM